MYMVKRLPSAKDGNRKEISNVPYHMRFNMNNLFGAKVLTSILQDCGTLGAIGLCLTCSGGSEACLSSHLESHCCPAAVLNSHLTRHCQIKADPTEQQFQAPQSLLRHSEAPMA